MSWRNLMTPYDKYNDREYSDMKSATPTILKQKRSYQNSTSPIATEANSQIKKYQNIKNLQSEFQDIKIKKEQHKRHISDLGILDQSKQQQETDKNFKQEDENQKNEIIENEIPGKIIKKKKDRSKSGNKRYEQIKTISSIQKSPNKESPSPIKGGYEERLQKIKGEMSMLKEQLSRYPRSKTNSQHNLSQLSHKSYKNTDIYDEDFPRQMNTSEFNQMQIHGSDDFNDFGKVQEEQEQEEDENDQQDFQKQRFQNKREERENNLKQNNQQQQQQQYQQNFKKQKYFQESQFTPASKIDSSRPHSYDKSGNKRYNIYNQLFKNSLDSHQNFSNEKSVYSGLHFKNSRNKSVDTLTQAKKHINYENDDEFYNQKDNQTSYFKESMRLKNKLQKEQQNRIKIEDELIESKQEISLLKTQLQKFESEMNTLKQMFLTNQSSHSTLITQQQNQDFSAKKSKFMNLSDNIKEENSIQNINENQIQQQNQQQLNKTPEQNKVMGIFNRSENSSNNDIFPQVSYMNELETFNSVHKIGQSDIKNQASPQFKKPSNEKQDQIINVQQYFKTDNDLFNNTSQVNFNNQKNNNIICNNQNQENENVIQQIISKNSMTQLQKMNLQSNSLIQKQEVAIQTDMNQNNNDIKIQQGNEIKELKHSRNYLIETLEGVVTVIKDENDKDYEQQMIRNEQNLNEQIGILRNFRHKFNEKVEKLKQEIEIQRQYRPLPLDFSQNGNNVINNQQNNFNNSKYNKSNTTSNSSLKSNSEQSLQNKLNNGKNQLSGKIINYNNLNNKQNQNQSQQQLQQNQQQNYINQEQNIANFFNTNINNKIDGNQTVNSFYDNLADTIEFLKKSQQQQQQYSNINIIDQNSVKKNEFQYNNSNKNYDNNDYESILIKQQKQEFTLQN